MSWHCWVTRCLLTWHVCTYNPISEIYKTLTSHNSQSSQFFHLPSYFTFTWLIPKPPLKIYQLICESLIWCVRHQLALRAFLTIATTVLPISISYKSRFFRQAFLLNALPFVQSWLWRRVRVTGLLGERNNLYWSLAEKWALQGKKMITRASPGRSLVSFKRLF